MTLGVAEDTVKQADPVVAQVQDAAAAAGGVLGRPHHLPVAPR